MQKNISKKGFTLIELLIVIGILAILIAAVVVVLNPAQLLKQARDSQRMSDLSSLESAINLYIATADSPSIGAGPSATVSGVSSPFIGGGTITSTTTTAVDGTGWVPVKLTDTSGGSPLSVLPVDPINDSTHFYAYAGATSTLTFELDTVLESTKYSGKMSTDGGDNTAYYEVGTDPGLNL